MCCTLLCNMYHHGNDYYCGLSEMRSFENLRPTDCSIGRYLLTVIFHGLQTVGRDLHTEIFRSASNKIHGDGFRWRQTRAYIFPEMTCRDNNQKWVHAYTQWWHQTPLGNSIVYSDYRTRIINDITDCRTYTVSIGSIELTEKSPHLSAHHRTLLSRISSFVYPIVARKSLTQI